MIYKKYFYS